MIEQKLFINDLEVDLNENVVFPITYSQSDAKNPNKRKRNASKTVVLPGTSKNNSFFASAWNLSISDIFGLNGFEFNPTLRYPCYVLKNGKKIFLGSINLRRITILNGVNSFHVVLFSEITNLFESLSNLLVSELGWGEYDHILNVTNIRNSWTAPTGSGYVYPLIDYGFTDDLLRYKTNEIYPFVYMVEVIKKCFQLSNFTVVGDWIDEPIINRIIWGYGGGKKLIFSDADIEASEVLLLIDNIGLAIHGGHPTTGDSENRYYDYILNIPVTDPNDEITIVEIDDDLNQFDPITGYLTVANSGDYRLNLTGIFNFLYQFPFLFSLPTTKNFSIKIYFRVFKNFSIIGQQVFTIEESVISGTAILTLALSLDISVVSSDVLSFDYVVDTFGTKMSVDGTSSLGGTPVMNFNLNLNDGFSILFSSIDGDTIDGDTMTLSRFLPNMKASDFLKDCFNMFNLYFSDPNENGEVVLEPAEKYFKGTDEADNYTDKLDRSKIIDIMPAANIEGKTYSFRWADDLDYYKSKYLEYYGENYGNNDYNVTSTFKKQNVIYQLKIAQSCPVQVSDSIIIPRIINLNETTLVSEPYKGKPRMFIYNGVKACDLWRLQNSDTGELTNNFTYPQAHHLDDLDSPTFDLNFGVPIRVFYIADAYTTNNLFSKHHVDFIRELTSIDSSVLTAYFKLDEHDLYTNFMRTLCNVNGVMYRKNLIKDFRVDALETTKVELIKVIRPRTSEVFEISMPEIELPDLDSVESFTSDIIVSDEISSYFVDSSNSNIIISLDDNKLRKGKEFVIKKIDNSQNNVQIQTVNQGIFIDGLVGKNLVNQYEFIRIKWDGNNFNIVG
jgi:hypothetical protein